MILLYVQWYYIIFSVKDNTRLKVKKISRSLSNPINLEWIFEKKVNLIACGGTALTDDFDLEYALSQIFSPKQKELIFKKLRGEKMTKTEKEYYSRSVKKKVIASANPDLHKLASKLLSK